MACTLTTSFPLDCRDSIGGIEEVLISEFGLIDAFTEAAGVITAITQTPTTGKFFRYSLEKENGNFDTTENVSVENGTTFYETVLNFTMKKMAAATSVELKLLALNRLAIIIKDNNGKYWALGFYTGADKVGGTNSASSGKAFGDMNGYTLGFTAKEKSYPLEVDSSVVATLVVG